MTRIRQAQATDTAAIATIYNHYVTETVVTFELDVVSAEMIRARIDEVLGHGLPWLVIEDDGAVLGYAYATHWRARPAYRHSVETTIYLAPRAMGRGMGRKLYTELLQALEARDVHTVIGGIALPNPASVALHESLGFAQVAHFSEVGYKFDRWVDVGFWQRMLRSH